MSRYPTKPSTHTVVNFTRRPILTPISQERVDQAPAAVARTEADNVVRYQRCGGGRRVIRKQIGGD